MNTRRRTWHCPRNRRKLRRQIGANFGMNFGTNFGAKKSRHHDKVFQR